MDAIDQVRSKAGFIIDMDGVIYHGNRLIPGVTEFIRWLEAQRKKYLFLTNSSERSPRELQQKLERLGIAVGEEHFYTSALATAAFLKSQQPGGSVFAIGDSGLINALYDAGFTMNDVNPDYVVVGESKMYTYDKITHAIRLVLGGAKLIGTNPDVHEPRRDRPDRPGAGARDRRVDGAHRAGHRREGVLRGQAEPAHHAERAEED
jgi:NagD protein